MLTIGHYALILCILGEPVKGSKERYYPEPEEAFRYLLGREKVAIIVPSVPKQVVVEAVIEEERPVQMCLKFDF